MPDILTETPSFRHVEPAIPTSWEEFMKVVESRRSVRVYTAEPLPENDVRDCLEAALLAPNSSNLQPWEFYWIRTPEIKKKLVKACFNQNAARTAAELIVCVARTKTWREHARQMVEVFRVSEPPAPKSAFHYYEKLAPFVYTQGPFGILGWIRRMAFAIAGLFRPVPREPHSLNQLRTWAIKSTALACENLMLAFRAKGFDSCPMEGFDAKMVRSALPLPRDARIVMIISAGKRAENGVYGPRIRFDSSKFIKEI